jgi:hypothetical protein
VASPAPSGTPLAGAKPTPTMVPMESDEIRLDGRLVDVTPTLATLLADSFTLPNGKSHRLDQPTEKTVTLHSDTTVHQGAVPLSLNSLKVGLMVRIIGPDPSANSDASQWLSARDIEIAGPIGAKKPAQKPKNS